MAYIKLYNTESNEIRLLNPRTEFDEIVDFVNEHFNVSYPIFKFTDEEGDVITFSSNDELIFLKELAREHGWKKIKIIVENNKRSIFYDNVMNQEVPQEDESKQSTDFLKLIEQNAPAFFSSLGIECTTYRNQTEIPAYFSNNSDMVSPIESKIENDSMMNESLSTLNVDLKVSQKTEDSSFKEDELTQRDQEKIVKKVEVEEPISIKQEMKVNEVSNLNEEKENNDTMTDDDSLIHEQESSTDQNKISKLEELQQIPVQQQQQQLQQQLPFIEPSFQQHESEEINLSLESIEYSDQLVKLCAMGFEDLETIKNCLIRSQGDIDVTINLLLN